MPASSAIDLEAVILSSDSQLIHTLVSCLQSSGIHVTKFYESGAAADYVSKRKVDAVIVDSEVAGAISVLNAVRETRSNSRSPTFATIHRRDLYGDFAASAHFVIEKPVPQEHFERALRAARGVMLRERRRYYRQPVEVPITLLRADGQVLSKGTTVNISESGMSLRCNLPMRAHEVLGIQFKLPGISTKFRCSAEVVWADSEGLGGLRFLPLEKKEHDALAKWLERV
ncbi:MAG TPA: PilZ domain-containing protein [Terriglobales bacterium]